VIPTVKRSATLLVLLGVCACNQTGTQMAAGLDPTGMASTAASLAPQAEEPLDEEASQFNLSQIAAPLQDIAAGNTKRRRLTSPVKGVMGQMAAMQAMSIAQTVVTGVMTGGAGLAAAAPNLAMQAATTGIAMGQMAAIDAQVETAMAQAEAARAANRIVPDEDRPAEARALLAIANGPSGKSMTWSNPRSGAAGRVTMRNKSNTGGMSCRAFEQEWTSGSETRKGHAAICEQNGIWYDLS
jgi:surface antigen